MQMLENLSEKRLFSPTKSRARELAHECLPQKTPQCKQQNLWICLLNSSGSSGNLERVHLVIRPLELEILSELLLHSSGHSLEDVFEDAKVGRVVLVIVTTLEDTGADKACVPSIKVLEQSWSA